MLRLVVVLDASRFRVAHLLVLSLRLLKHIFFLQKQKKMQPQMQRTITAPIVQPMMTATSHSPSEPHASPQQQLFSHWPLWVRELYSELKQKLSLNELKLEKKLPEKKLSKNRRLAWFLSAETTGARPRIW